MGNVKQTVVEMILLGLLSAGLAFGYNAVRKEGRIVPTKDYFEKGEKPSAPPTGTARQEAAADRTVTAVSRSASVGESPAPRTKPAPASAKKHKEHPYKEITLDDVRDVVNDPETAQGLNVFIDARKDDDFAEGHIPGAIPCFPYEIDRCIDRAMAAVNGAMKVIVYCGGGDCEDSIFMCRELVNAGAPFDAIHLFAGGWNEWKAGGGATETGMER